MHVSAPIDSECTVCYDAHLFNIYCCITDTFSWLCPWPLFLLWIRVLIWLPQPWLLCRSLHTQFFVWLGKYFLSLCDRVMLNPSFELESMAERNDFRLFPNKNSVTGISSDASFLCFWLWFTFRAYRILALRSMDSSRPVASITSLWRVFIFTVVLLTQVSPVVSSANVVWEDFSETFVVSFLRPFTIMCRWSLTSNSGT